MRVTSNTFPSSLLNQLTTLTARQSQLQTQAATGQTIQSPEDDPTAMRRVLDLQAENNSVAQYQRNISRHQELASVTFDSVKALKKISDRASEIVISADGLKSKQELTVYATEVSELIKQAVQIANTKNRGDFIFGGTQTDKSPFTAALDSSGQVTKVDYQGNTTVPETEIAEGVTVSAQVPGANTSGSGTTGLITDSRTGADLFNHLISLQQHLAAGDSKTIAETDRAQLGKDEENLLFHLSSNGAIQARLEASSAKLSQRSLALNGLVSKEADADLAQTIVKLQQTQTAYQAALQSGSMLLNRSLLDYLR